MPKRILYDRSRQKKRPPSANCGISERVYPVPFPTSILIEGSEESVKRILRATLESLQDETV